jgi:hypothetical protein
MNYYWEANDNFKILMNEIDKFKIPVQKRLRQIKKDWANLVAFYLHWERGGSRIPRPSGWGGRTQFDLQILWTICINFRM